MNLNKLVSSSIKVVSPGVIHCVPGGTYDASGNNWTELTMVKLYLLRHFVDLTSEEVCCNGESTIILHKEVLDAADKLYTKYAPFIEQGCNIFEKDDYYEVKALDQYKRNPIVAGGMNAPDDEQTEGLPKGWWWEPGSGVATKFLEGGQVNINIVDDIIYIYQHAGSIEDNPIKQLEMKTIGDFAKIHTIWPYGTDAEEITTVCIFVFRQN